MTISSISACDTPPDGHASGVAWGAVFAGAAAAAALSFILLILGVGLGLTSMSPYAYHPAPVGKGAIVWLAFMQLAASGMGGYIAGRLRLKWVNVHGDEVHFRDTAHGMLAWAVATLLTVAVQAGAGKAALGGAIDSASAITTAAAPVVAATTSKGGPGPVAAIEDYYTDMLLRSNGGDSVTDAQRGELRRILLAAMSAGNMSPEDRDYLAQQVAGRSGMNLADAQRRVDDIYMRATKASNDAKEKAKQLADDARKAGAHSALWMFVALLLGAFIASLAATLGGRQRDHERVMLRPAN